MKRIVEGHTYIIDIFRNLKTSSRKNSTRPEKFLEILMNWQFSRIELLWQIQNNNKTYVIGFVIVEYKLRCAIFTYLKRSFSSEITQEISPPL